MPWKKEPYFYTTFDKQKEPDGSHEKALISKLSEYVKLFNGAKEGNIIGEATPFYLYEHKDVIRNIKLIYGKENYKKIKIIILLRNPAERAWSNYMYLRRNMKEPLDFKKAIDLKHIEKRMKEGESPSYDYIGLGKYFEQVRAFKNEFKAVKIVFFDYCFKPA